MTDGDGFVVGLLGSFNGGSTSPGDMFAREGSESDRGGNVYFAGTSLPELADPFPTGSPVSSTTAGPTRSTAVTAVTTTVPIVTTTTKPAVTSTTGPIVTTTTVGGGGAPAGSVQLRPGDNVASIVSGAAAGTTFWFNPGTYSGVSIAPKANQVFLGAAGAVLAGNGKAFAFRSAAAGVTIRGLVIEGYKPADRAAVVDGVDGGTGWTVAGNEIRNNGQIGIRARRDWTVSGNYVHHNGRYGIVGSGSGLVIENNEIASNAGDYGATGDSSGTKFTHTTNLVIRGNYAHNNFGNGLWVDINNVNALIEGNRSIANTRQGIFLEISCGGTIRNNYLEGNGTDDKNPNYMSASGILVSMTPDVQVYGNTLVNNTKGIGAIHWDHGNVDAVTNCQPQLRNLRVYSNSITQNGSAAAGIDASIDVDKVYGSWDNQFYSNTYILSGGAQFRYQAGWISQQQWNNAGQS
jgi:hypothetical protein